MKKNQNIKKISIKEFNDILKHLEFISVEEEDSKTIILYGLNGKPTLFKVVGKEYKDPITKEKYGYGCFKIV